ncbi:MAG: type II toxin-antitoxin system HicA family toxin [Chloroflexia bacterium]|nr:type II toxin-antitoxin system HicA family toxin [Chloroflexia bacterium]
MTGRLPRVTGTEVVRALQRSGWEVVRVRGSHHILRHPDQPGMPIVPCHAGHTLAPGTLKSVLRDAGLTSEQLKSLL